MFQGQKSKLSERLHWQLQDYRDVGMRCVARHNNLIFRFKHGLMFPTFHDSEEEEKLVVLQTGCFAPMQFISEVNKIRCVI